MKVCIQIDNITSNYGIIIPINKTKTKAARRRDPIRCKAVINNKITE